MQTIESLRKTNRTAIGPPLPLYEGLARTHADRLPRNVVPPGLLTQQPPGTKRGPGVLRLDAPGSGRSGSLRPSVGSVLRVARASPRELLRGGGCAPGRTRTTGARGRRRCRECRVVVATPTAANLENRGQVALEPSCPKRWVANFFFLVRGESLKEGCVKSNVSGSNTLLA